MGGLEFRLDDLPEAKDAKAEAAALKHQVEALKLQVKNLKAKAAAAEVMKVFRAHDKAHMQWKTHCNQDLYTKLIAAWAESTVLKKQIEALKVQRAAELKKTDERNWLYWTNSINRIQLTDTLRHELAAAKAEAEVAKAEAEVAKQNLALLRLKLREL